MFHGSKTTQATKDELMMKAWMETHPSSNVLIVWKVDERSELKKMDSHLFYKVYGCLY